MTNKLQGKVALITGASAGIGRACARALASEGARLVLTARRQERLDALKKEAESLGTEAVSISGDAREEETAIRTVKAAADVFGRIDILINNTGAGNYKNLVDTSAEEYDETHGRQCAHNVSFYASCCANNAGSGFGHYFDDLLDGWRLRVRR